MIKSRKFDNNTRIKDLRNFDRIGSCLEKLCPSSDNNAVNMSEIISSNVNAETNDNEQVIEDLQNVGSVDKTAKLSALLDNDTKNPSPVKEVSNGVSTHGDQPELHHNGTTQNGHKVTDPTPDTKTDDASSPASNSVVSQSPKEKTPAEAAGTGVSPKKSDAHETPNNESKSETSCVSDVASEIQTGEQSTEDNNTEKSCSESNSTSHSQSVASTTSESDVPSSAESSECPVKDASTGDQDSVNKQMEELNVESSGSKGPSPAKKSCSPF